MSWREIYIQRLKAASESQLNEPASGLLADIINVCQECAILQSQLAVQNAAEVKKEKGKLQSHSASAGSPSQAHAEVEMRLELAKTIKERDQERQKRREGEKEIELLYGQLRKDEAASKELRVIHKDMVRKFKDLSDELKAKTDFANSLQNDLLAANVEANVLYERVRALEAEKNTLLLKVLENKQKVVDKMNEQNEPRLARKP